MKNKLGKWLLMLACALSLTSISTVSEAYQCRWVPAHWQNGYYVNAHKVCWNDHGYYHTGYYHNGHRGGYYHHCWWRNGYRYCR